MTQPQQSVYGGRSGYGAYNAPPPSQYAGYPPSSATPQQDPNRFYGAGAPSSQGQPSQYLPAGSNPAFFMVPPGEQRPQQTPAPQAGPPANVYGDPSLNRVPVGRPQSSAPQELSTAHYDSPVDNRQSFVGAPPGAPSAPQGYDFPPSQQPSQPPGYPPQSSAPQGPLGQQNPYEHITSPPPQQQPHDQQPPSDQYAQAPHQSQYGYPPQQQPSLPGYAPPAPPGTTSSPTPQSQAYLPYRPGGQAPSAPVGGGGGDEGFYR